MRADAVAKHCGILTAPDRFIHAYERSGVVEVPLDPAWRRRVAFAFLLASRRRARASRLGAGDATGGTAGRRGSSVT